MQCHYQKMSIVLEMGSTDHMMVDALCKKYLIMTVEILNKYKFIDDQKNLLFVKFLFIIFAR